MPESHINRTVTRYIFFILRAQNFSRATISFYQTDNEKKGEEGEREKEREAEGERKWFLPLGLGINRLIRFRL